MSWKMDERQEHQVSPLRVKVLTAAGLTWLGAGASVLALDPLLSWTGRSDVQVWGKTGQLLVSGAGMMLLLWGVLTVRFRSREIMTNLNLMAISLLIATPLLAEIGLRLGIATGLAKFRQAGLYADPLGDDDYYRLRSQWQPEESGDVAGRFHPLLGWAPPESPDNPLGIKASGPYEYDPAGRNVLFFGDSFVAGTTVPMEQHIPQVLDSLLPEARVLNYGVGGYGLDQIYLRFKATHEKFEDPEVIIGIMLTDLDRSILTFRTGPKPFFVLSGGELQLRGAPMEYASPQWAARFEPDLRSYLLAYCFRSWMIVSGGGDRMELPYRRDEKLEINRAILQAITQEASAHGLSLTFVTFDSDPGVAQRGWRHKFLHEEFRRLDVPHLDTGRNLRAFARDQNLDVRDLMAPDGHPNALANSLIARDLAALLADAALR